MLELELGVAGGARGWVVGRAGLWGVLDLGLGSAAPCTTRTSIIIKNDMLISIIARIVLPLFSFPVELCYNFLKSILYNT